MNWQAVDWRGRRGYPRLRIALESCQPLLEAYLKVSGRSPLLRASRVDMAARGLAKATGLE